MDKQDLQEKLNVIKTDFQNMLYFLSKKQSAHGKLNRLPCYLIIGQPEAGKSTLLTHAEQAYILSKKSDGVCKTSEKCSWWATREAIFLDIPGAYLVPNNNKDNPCAKQLLSLIKSHRSQLNLAGIFAIFDVNDVITRSQASNDARIKQVLGFCQALDNAVTQPLNLNIVLSKCDLMPGFISFFSDHDKDYLEQPWGFALPHHNERSLIEKYAIEQFNLLITQINAQLIWRLHHEHNELKRSLIKLFPLQVEKVKRKLSSCLASFCHQASSFQHIHLHELYLISATRPNELDHAHSSTDLTKIDAKNAIYTEKAIFVNDMIAKNIAMARSTPNVCKLPTRKMQLISIIVCALLIITSTFVLSEKFTHNILTVMGTESLLENITKHPPQDVNDLLSTINELQTEQDKLSAQSGWITRMVLTDNHAKLRAHTQAMLDELLTKKFKPTLAKTLTAYIKQHQNDPEHLYIALKMYLMLCGETSLDVDYISNHLAQVLTVNTSYPLKNILHQALMNSSPETADTHLIENTRSVLNNLRDEMLSLILLYAESPPTDDISMAKHINHENIFHIAPEYATIPALYTNTYYQTIDQAQRQAIAEAISTGNAVLGKRHHVNSTLTADKIWATYLKDYAHSWSQLVNHIQLNTMQNEGSLLQTLAALSDVDSPILTLLDQIDKNLPPEVLKHASHELLALHDTLKQMQTPETSSLYQAFVALRHLQRTLSPIQASQNQGQANVDVAKQLLESNNAISQLTHANQSLPSPIHRWVQTIITTTQSLIFTEAGRHINQQWKTTIANPFRQNVSHRYPFDPKGADLTLTMFADFFNQHGNLESFEEQYIFPFLNLNGKTWSVKPDAAPYLNLPSDVMSQLKRFAVIQEAFFAEKHSAPYFKFKLAAVDSDIRIEGFQFTLGKQRVLTQSGLPNIPSVLEWPELRDDTTSVALLGDNSHMIKESGVWGLHKLINRYAKVPPYYKDKTIQLSIPLGPNQSAHYTVSLLGDFNPFSVSYLQSTWMPLWIFKVHANAQ